MKMSLREALRTSDKAELRIGNPIFPSILVRVTKKDPSAPVGTCSIEVCGSHYPNGVSCESVATQFDIINMLAQKGVYCQGRQLPDWGWTSEFQSF